LILSEITPQKPLERKIFIQIWPVNSEWRKFNVAELLGRSLGQTGIPIDRETDLHPTFHLNQNVGRRKKSFAVRKFARRAVLSTSPTKKRAQGPYTKK